MPKIKKALALMTCAVTLILPIGASAQNVPITPVSKAAAYEGKQSDIAAIQKLIKTYAKSVDNADTELAATIWQTTEATTFIHPRGNEYGWEAVKNNFYGKTMGETFSKRELQIHDIYIELYGDTAVAVFYWDFPAVFRKDGSKITTHGRETQVLKRTPTGWKIVHVHYSNMPVTGDKQGF